MSEYVIPDDAVALACEAFISFRSVRTRGQSSNNRERIRSLLQAAAPALVAANSVAASGEDPGDVGAREALAAMVVHLRGLSDGVTKSGTDLRFAADVIDHAPRFEHVIAHRREILAEEYGETS